MRCSNFDLRLTCEPAITESGRTSGQQTINDTVVRPEEDHMSDDIALASAARLFGRLTIGKIDAEYAEDLWEPERRDALEQLGLELPSRTEGDLTRLAAEYFEAFVDPQSQPPLVQSVCEEGRYDGAATESVRNIATAMGVEFDDETARCAPPDQLGAALLLWAELVEDRSVAREFAARHLIWALPHLERRSTGEGFYSRLAGVIAEFIAVISSR